MPLPAGQGPPTPAAVARALLDRVVAYYAAHADDPVDPPAPLPEQQYLVGGEPRLTAWDLDAGQVTVCCARTVTGYNTTAPTGYARLPRANPANAPHLTRSAVLEVQIVRPAPAQSYVRRIPAVDTLDAHGYALGLDMTHLARAITQAARDGHLTRERAGEAPIVFGDCEAIGPAGKLAGIAQAVTVPLL